MLDSKESNKSPFQSADKRKIRIHRSIKSPTNAPSVSIGNKMTDNSKNNNNSKEIKLDVDEGNPSVIDSQVEDLKMTNLGSSRRKVVSRQDNYSLTLLFI